MSYLPLENKRREALVKRTTKELRQSKIKFDSIVCTGLSGVLVAAEVATKLKKNLIIIRKGESSHGSPVEYLESTEGYVIIDDFKSSGATIRRIYRKMKNYFYDSYFPEELCMGVYFYNRRKSRLQPIEKAKK